MDTDYYRTTAKPSEEILFKEKNSKFLGQTFPVATEEDIRSILMAIRKQHSKANHVCYAWQLGEDSISYRANDDGEPTNSAGLPIYGQLQSFDLTNILITVTRYFGGTKLGVSGLISAYRTAAKMALEASQVIKKPIEAYFLLQFDYTDMNKVMRTIKKYELNICKQKMELLCEIEISVLKSNAEKVSKFFEPYPKISIQKIF